MKQVKQNSGRCISKLADNGNASSAVSTRSRVHTGTAQALATERRKWDTQVSTTISQRHYASLSCTWPRDPHTRTNSFQTRFWQVACRHSSSHILSSCDNWSNSERVWQLVAGFPLGIRKVPSRNRLSFSYPQPDAQSWSHDSGSLSYESHLIHSSNYRPFGLTKFAHSKAGATQLSEGKPPCGCCPPDLLDSSRATTNHILIRTISSVLDMFTAKGNLQPDMA